MGMFSKLYNNEDASFDDEDRDLEELYQKLFKKIARDFVYKRDLSDHFDNFILGLERNSPELASSLRADSVFLEYQAAILQAVEYKENLKKPKNKRIKYKDVDDE